uniref:Protein ANTAGONIST OF LIKE HETEROCHROMATIN PROTEIN 1-like n=1 Tax=Diabrotica virgifera virgifera TaxID=50390 RepID=A0A6P7F550_DIAVI
MDRYVLETFLYTSDCGEDGYLFNSSSSSSDSEDDEVECTCDAETEPPPDKKQKLTESGETEAAVELKPKNKTMLYGLLEVDVKTEPEPKKKQKAYEFVELDVPTPTDRKQDGFVEIEVPILNEYDFKNSFRVNKTTYAKVLEMLYPSFSADHKGGRERITAEKATYIFLWYLGNKETFKQMADRFKNTTSTLHGIVKTATSALSQKLSAQIIWPSDAEYSNISKLFQQVGNLKGCLGVLGVSYIRIKSNIKNNEIYENEHYYQSVILQGVVTVNGKFLDIFIGGGSNKPEQLLQKSQLFIEAENNLLGDYYLLSSKDYSNRKWLVKPYKDNGHLTVEQTIFNTCHQTIVNTFTESIGFLKGRFQRLQNVENRAMGMAVQCVESACMIHNLAIDCEDEHEDFCFLDFPDVEAREDVLPQDDINGERRDKALEDLINNSSEYKVR